jgi:hypothetical protein
VSEIENPEARSNKQRSTQDASQVRAFEGGAAVSQAGAAAAVLRAAGLCLSKTQPSQVKGQGGCSCKPPDRLHGDGATSYSVLRSASLSIAPHTIDTPGITWLLADLGDVWHPHAEDAP